MQKGPNPLGNFIQRTEEIKVRAIYGGVKENLKNAKMLLAPLLVVTKSAKAIYSAVNPMSSGALKFRTKMYGLIQRNYNPCFQFSLNI